MRSLFNLSLLTSVAALLLAFFAGSTIFEPITCGLLFALVFLSREDENSLLLTLIFAITFALDTVMVYFITYVIIPAVESYYVENIYAFGIQLTLSLLLLFLLRHRMTIAVLITRGKSASVFEKNHVEGPLYLLVMLLVFIDFMALMENFLRNLEHLGVNEELAKTFWDVTFFFDYFPYLKAVPMLLCVTMLYVGLVVRTKRQPIQS
ncbi:hypothetical protein BB427_12575 [Pseudoalteromonas sp. BMB]|uniref:hypothetical protein n=1 Tax=Pseudoalteromonas sp. BMB TaxID=1874619 RepID=UPI00083E5EBC|nr:hypothetical protein [Pseudoalteromonas sp. BMB]ODB38604.1 hypothetical protein BB427_12575 [Pseudoalteromonas sp. BMB]